MGQLSDALRNIQNNPDDLTSLPNLIAQVGEMEDKTIPNMTEQNEALMEKYQKAQARANEFLAQIPIPGQEPNQPDEPKPVTFEEGKANLLGAIKEVNQ